MFIIYEGGKECSFSFPIENQHISYVDVDIGSDNNEISMVGGTVVKVWESEKMFKSMEK